MTATMTQTDEATVGSERHNDQAISHGVLLALCCLLSYKIITLLLTVSRFVPRDDELLGGMWAVVATIFVFRRCYEESTNAALTRASATLFSFVLCLMYLLIFPFRLWGMVALIAIGAIVLEAIGRSQDVVTACITTAVVLVVAGIAPQHAWKQPILRLIDTIVGTLVGVAGAWIAHKMPRFISFSETPFSIPRKPNHGTSQRTDHSVDEVH